MKKKGMQFLEFILQRHPCIASGGKIPVIFAFVNAQIQFLHFLALCAAPGALWRRPINWPDRAKQLMIHTYRHKVYVRYIQGGNKVYIRYIPCIYKV